MTSLGPSTAFRGSTHVLISGIAAIYTRTKHTHPAMCAKRITATTNTMDRSGFRLQRHLEVVYTAPYHFNSSHTRRVRIHTEIILEFALHQHPLVWNQPPEDQMSGEDEVRVVLVTGFLNTKETWTPTLETMLRQWSGLETDKRLRILTFDNRGVGGSTSPIGPYTTRNMAEDALALLDHVGWEQVHVVGYSMGGMISLELAHMAPDRVKSLSLLCTTRGRYIPACNGVLPMTRTLNRSDVDLETHNLLAVLYPPKFLSQEMEDESRSIYEAMFECHKYLVENRETPRVFGFVGQGSAVLSHFVSDERLRESAITTSRSSCLVGRKTWSFQLERRKRSTTCWPVTIPGWLSTRVQVTELSSSISMRLLTMSSRRFKLPNLPTTRS